MATKRPALHTLLYADPGAGKSTLSATFPKPMLVLMFDPYGKDQPYLGNGNAEVSDLLEGEYGPYREVKSKKTGKLLRRIEYYGDKDLDDLGTKGKDQASWSWNRFLRRMAAFTVDVQEMGIRTVVLDSISYAELSCRKYQEKVLNPNSREPRQWFAATTDALEELLMIRFGALPINVVVCAHVDDSKIDMHGHAIRSPNAPGRLQKKLAAAYGEVYHIGVDRDEDGNPVRLIQTQSDGMWMASTQINAPDGCDAHYLALWDNYQIGAAGE